ncbi:MAG: ergothioneine biosynthesis protein EgtC [Pseudonocardia sp.]|nr:ergothioneine biosynthesis protein EgtC [Pseudonocardia sp.]
MCRHLAYLGPVRTLASLILDPPHGLLHQSYAPADMRGGGTVNADGFGAAWYPGAGGVGEPTRVRSAVPIWSDTSFAQIAAATVSSGVLAAVRSATTGMPVTSTAAAPFAEGRWLFSHNGVVRGWPGSVAGLAAALPTVDLMTLDAPTDAALLWALVRHRLRAGDDPAGVLAETCAAVEAAAPGSRLNLLLTDGATIWGTAWDHALAVHTTPDATTVASEPIDTLPAWTQVPDRHLVVARPGRHELHPIDTRPPVPPSPSRRADRASEDNHQGAR